MSETATSAAFGGRPSMSFEPVFNGMDYLGSAVDDLTAHQPPTARDLKYAVLHLQAAVEVLLKARLVREHWSLVFKDPGAATRARFDKGDFVSCDSAAVMDRLSNIVGLTLDDDDRQSLRTLTKTRNALTHWGHTAPAHAVEGNAVGVLHFLLSFIDGHLAPSLSADAQVVELKLGPVRAKLSQIERLVKLRMDSLRADLEPVSDRTVACPGCDQWALVVGGTPVVCRFCTRRFDSPLEMAQEYAWVTRRSHEYIVMESCSSCLTDRTLVVARTAQAKDTTVALCFACGVQYELSLNVRTPLGTPRQEVRRSEGELG
ncbi:hypothetical protein [Streptomyces xantholiticus]|uniref:Uncharacterized protein n=1 Tax=Streptomyces xantholiticus TaxID=68285 RepID=A0ABV1UZU1_9ACTN